MKKTIWLMLLTSCAFPLFSQSFTVAPRTGKASMDGKLDDDVWQIASRYTLVKYKGGKPQFKTEVQAAYNDSYLYFAIVCHEPDIDGLVVKKVEHDDGIWEDDCVEIFLDPAGNGREYYHFLVNSKGVLQEEKCDPTGVSARWNTYWRAEVRVDPDAKTWTAEIAIQLQDMITSPDIGNETFRFNVNRERKKKKDSPEENQGLVPTPKGFMSPTLFPRLEGLKIDFFPFISKSLEERVAAFPDRIDRLGREIDRFAKSHPEASRFRVEVGELSAATGQLKIRVAALPGIAKKKKRLEALEAVRSEYVSLSSRFDALTHAYRSLFYSTRMTSTFRIDDPGYLVGVETALRKFFRDTPEPERWFSDTAEVSLARNEYEPFQVIVTAYRDGVKDVRVTVGDLKLIDGEGIIPASEITVNPEGYVRTIRPYYTSYYMPDHGQTMWPDPLLEEKVVAEVKPFETQPFWITIHTSEDILAGDYVGVLRIESAGAPPVDLTLKVHVWDFAVPKESHLVNVWLLFRHYLCQYHNVKKNTDEYARLVDVYLRDMLAHRMMESQIGTDSPGPHPNLNEDGTASDDTVFAEWDAYVQQYLDLGLNYLTVPVSMDMKKEYLINSLRAYTKHLERKGWMKYVYVTMSDETLNGVEKYAWVKEAAPQLRTWLTWHPMPEYSYVDIWCPQIFRGHYQHPDRIQWAKDHGKTLWVYTSSDAEDPFPAMNVDVKAVDPRLTYWFCWKHDYKGFLYWCANYWASGNPWDSAECYPSQNGNGSVYYPGKNGPVHSLRIELVRDGMEDYEYLWLLKDSVEKLRDDPQHTEFVKACDRLLTFPEPDLEWCRRYEERPEELLALRAKIAKAIEKAQALLCR